MDLPAPGRVAVGHAPAPTRAVVDLGASARGAGA